MNDTPSPSINETIVERFESAWVRGEPEPIERLKLDRSDPCYLATLEELVHLELEFAWKTGAEVASNSASAAEGPIPSRPRVEHYFGRFPELDVREIALRLVQQEYLVRCRFGDRPSRQEYCDRFPEIIRTGDEIAFRHPAEFQQHGESKESDLRPGGEIGRYVLIDEAGRGGFGQVWQVEDTRLGRRIALKQMSERVAKEEDLRRRFIAEARISAGLEHPGVVPIYDLDQLDEHHPYYTMKLVKGETLDAAIERFHKPSVIPPTTSRSLEFQKLLGVFVSICRTMEYAHAHNVIHRDLKPQNIVLGDYGETIVLDWGLAKVVRPVAESARQEAASAILADWDAGQTQEGSVQGTPAYMSPEQADGRTELAGPRTDIYALGVILYQLLAGVLPFEGNSAIEVLQKVQEGRFSPPRSVNRVVPRALEAVCLKAMARHPENRYGLVRELREDIERYLADEPTSVLKESWRDSVLRWCRHHRSAVSGLFALLFTAVVVLSISTLVVNSERIAKQKALDLADREQRRRLDAKVDSLLSANSESVPVLLEELWQEEQSVLARLRELRETDDLSASQRLRVDLALIRSEPSVRGSVQERMLKADVNEVCAIRQALAGCREESAEELWEIARNEREEDSIRLRASCALATLDPSSPNWTAMGTHIASNLAAQSPANIADWIKAFRPVGTALIPFLQAMYQGEDSSATRSLLATILAECGDNDAGLLVDLIETSSPEGFNHLLPKLLPHKSIAAARLHQRLDGEPPPEWKDGDDSQWAKPPVAAVRQIEEAQGIVNDRFAFAQLLPFDKFTEIAENLRPSGYRPIRFRPYRMKESLHTCVVWSRDDRNWQMAEGLTATEMLRTHRQMEAAGHLAEDLAGYIVEREGRHSERFCGLWAERPDPGYHSVIVVGEKLQVPAQVTSDYFCRRLQEFHSAESELRYCAVYWRSQGALQWHIVGGPVPGYRESGFETRLSPSELLADVSTVCVPMAEDPFDAQRFYDPGKFQAVLSPQAAKAFAAGVEALFRGDTQLAGEELAIASETAELFWPAHGLLAISHARRGDQAAAIAALERIDQAATKFDSAFQPFLKPRERQIIAELLEIDPAFYRAMVDIYLGKEQEALEGFDEWLSEFPRYIEVLFLGACVYSTAAGEIQKRGGESKDSSSSLARLQVYRKRSVELLAQWVQAAPDENVRQCLTHGYLDPIRNTEGFRQLVEEDGFHRRYAAVWLPHLGGTFEWRELHGLTPSEQLEQCMPLADENFRPRSIAICVSPTGTVSAASVWHRPIVPGKERVAEKSRKINAALALIRMGDVDLLSRCLRQQAEPDLRTGLIQRLAFSGVDSAVLARFAHDEDPWIQQGAILALGTSDGRATLPNKQRLIPEVLRQFRENPHPGVHSAAEWLLHCWGQTGDLRKIDRDSQDSQSDDDRQWFVNAHGHTLAVIQGPVEFWMGSPGDESGRLADELLHRRRISRSFAVATKETTTAQFKQFAPDFSYRKLYSPGDDTPIVDVDWYDAARYCRWLSEQEGISEDQMCFPSLDQIGPEMKLPADCLSRTGYRLPTEAEWEYACRAGSSTPCFFGEDMDQQARYTWIVGNSGGSSNPVGTRTPNGFGLFDTHGNVGELCIGTYGPYEYRQGSPIEDQPALRSSGQRVVRGGSFLSNYYNIRSARRFSGNPAEPSLDVGFRIARTVPESPR